ncbi:MAG: hypothetical protein ACH0QD_04445 [Tepidibacillus sp.]
MVENIILVATLVAAFFLFFKMQKKSKKDTPITVQDVIGKNLKVFPNGMIQKEDMFRAVVEIGPIGLNTKSQLEKNAVWANYRMLLNTLTIPYTLFAQSQYLDIKDYTNWYKEQIDSNEFLTPELKESGEDVYNHLNNSDEDKNTRDYRHYIILHYNPKSESIDSGVQTGNNAIDDFLKKLSGNSSTITQEELEDLAQQVLDEATQFIFQASDIIGLQYRRLDRQNIYNMVYSTLQREMANSIRLSDAVDAQSFTAQIDSITARLFTFDYDDVNQKGA